ncbi:MAG: AraC family transcriptional regulator [Pirellulales bacterium]|nr:AraC family transcriptional regulator [Pirellulales bacterium]
MYLALASHGLLLEQRGHCRFTGQGWTNNLHRHYDFQEICWVTHGEGRYLHGGTMHELQAGSCFISEPNVLHEISSPSENMILYWMDFRVSEFLSEVDHEAARIWDAFRKSHVIHAHVPGADLFWKLIRNAPHRHRESFLMRALFLESLIALTGSSPSECDTEADPCMRAMAYIQRHCRDSLAVARVAEAVGLSERQLRRRFKTRFSIGLVDAINRARLDEARSLLLMQASVKAAAEAVGIASPAMFSRLFKKAFGCTPSHWRKQKISSGIPAQTILGQD